jgi:2-isopropylmalate synthase
MYDGDIEAIIMNAGNASAGPWVLKSMQVASGTDQAATATITLVDEHNKETTEMAEASGPVEAAFQALERATGITLTLKKFELHSATIGDDAQGEVTVTVEHNDEPHRGHAACIDIVEAGSRAYLEVINRILRRRDRNRETARIEPDVNRAPI